jgi:hypothetical protein
MHELSTCDLSMNLYASIHICMCIHTYIYIYAYPHIILTYSLALAAVILPHISPFLEAYTCMRDAPSGRSLAT